MTASVMTTMNNRRRLAQRAGRGASPLRGTVRLAGLGPGRAAAAGGGVGTDPRRDPRMRPELGERVQGQLGIAMLSGPVIAHPDGGRWTFLTRARTRCPRTRRRSGGPRGSARGRGVVHGRADRRRCGDWRWVNEPKPHQMLPSAYAVVATARRLCSGGSGGLNPKLTQRLPPPGRGPFRAGTSAGWNASGREWVDFWHENCHRLCRARCHSQVAARNALGLTAASRWRSWSGMAGLRSCRRRHSMRWCTRATA